MRSVFRATPVSLLDIAGLEGWLEEQANKGLFPQWVTSDFTQFYRGEAVPGTRFRLEAARGREAPSPEQLELYQEAGWQYAHSINALTSPLLFGPSEPLYFLFYSADPAAPEPHTDPATQAVSLEALAGQVKKWRRRLWISRLALLILFVLPALLLFQSDRRQLPLYLLDVTGYFLFFLLLLLWMWRRAEREYRRMLDLRDALERGEPLVSKAPPPKTWGQRLALPAAALLAGAMLFLSWRGGGLSLPFVEGRLTPLAEFSRPYIPLARLENEPLASWDELFGPASWSEDHNTAAWSFSLLAPDWYTVDQTMLSLHGGTGKRSVSPPAARRNTGTPATWRPPTSA